ncbi:formyl-CoA transferase [Bordetella genomosp. 10]|uniref:Formyl-CoA transferase n=1 Tax=Bordetella genomosp. 10 TaxID=1416804 RepID=A0A261SIR4_9BORD|nr:CaiB/BaiF CoA-transferase family protein [Bordetella genomosp. 10]OZI36931.1 formyl-CoA transferase [Bordetella genomosp. 10]
MTENASLPLHGYRILDLTRVRSGPTAVRQLADWGADVIKVELPVEPNLETEMGGTHLGPDYQNLHRNKRSLTLNLKKQAGVEIFRRLVETADVVVENYRPEVKHRLGIDYETLKKNHPGLIYASISGFGQDGPYVKRPAYDQIIQGMTGMMSVTGLPAHGPVRAGVAIADTTAGLYCALGILMALLQRERTGAGQWVQTSLLESLLAVMDFQAARWLVAGELPVQAGNDHPTIIPTGVYDTQDGKITICASGQTMWQRLCRALDRPMWLADPRFVGNRERSANRHILNGALQAIFSGNTSAHWIDKLSREGLACGPVNTVSQAFDDPQVRHLGTRWDVMHPVLGNIGLVGQPIRSSATSSGVRSLAPTPGQHTDEVLRELGLSAAHVAELRGSGVV